MAKKAARMKYKAARARSRLDGLALGTFNVLTGEMNSVYGLGHIDTLLRTCATKGCKLSYCRTPNGTEHPKLLHLDSASISAVTAAGSKGKKGNMGLDWR